MNEKIYCHNLLNMTFYLLRLCTHCNLDCNALWLMIFELMVQKKKTPAIYYVNFHDPSPISFLTHVCIVVAH